MNVLERKPDLKITPEIAGYFVNRELEAYQVSGDCLEQKGIPDKSYLFFDVDMRPSFGDVTICRIIGILDPMAKMLYGPSVQKPGSYLVSTCYMDSSRDQKLIVSSVKGVAIACFKEDGSLLWRRPTPEEIEKNHLSINTLEGWTRLCRESAADRLKEHGIEPTEENIDQYLRDLKRELDDEYLATRKLKQAA